MTPSGIHALIAGGGGLPDALLRAMRARDCTPIICGFIDNVHRPDTQIAARLDRPGRLFRDLRRHGVRYVTLCGTFHRPALHRLRPDCTLLRELPALLPAMRCGDDGLLRAVLRLFEKRGFIVPDPEDLAPDLLMPRGALTRATPAARDLADIALGQAVLQALGPLDIGQGCVVAGGRVLGIEAAEGTDALLERIGALPPERRGRGGVFVKAPKLGQERRVDLPTIGTQTVARVVAAGLRGMALQAGDVYVLERAQVRAAAEAAGIFVVGFQAGESFACT